MNLLLSPHNDDETLFASYLCLRHKPHVVVCFRSSVQETRYGITARERERETDRAMSVLGCRWEQWSFPDGNGWDGLEAHLRAFAQTHDVEEVFAPAREGDGPREHNAVAAVARRVFADRVTYYTTYRNGGVRSRGTEVEPEPWMIPLKLRALSCYESQTRTPSLVHFLDPIREYVK